ncbi:MAG: polyprenyl synthetase family protein [Candidatus Omnitrophica bacterium]|nr:polyprenyl synthetase family protein [Candidatus Omnitrophota bacterium]
MKKIHRKKDRCSDLQALVNRALKKHLSGLKGPAALLAAMKYAVFSGGKRLRPILAIESCRAANGGINDALPFACAIELIHSFSLVHDDLPAMDDDDFRRGKPACHKKFGEGMAILAGDGLLNLAFGIMAGIRHKNSAKIALLLSKATGTEKMIGGQALDIGLPGRAGYNSKRKMKINAMKTAALISASCQAGVLAASSGRIKEEKMRRFGVNVGLAFQICDDIKDQRYGKRILERMKAEATVFIAKAKKELEPFGEKADLLNDIADNVIKRTF